MGLLDEAIRDHLELKRRRGADPSEIAQAEHEALEPVFPPEEEGADAAPADVAGEPQAEPFEAAPEGSVAAPEAHGFQEHMPEDDAFSAVGQETAEIDMSAVLNEHADLLADGAAPESSGTIEDSILDWESPYEQTEPPPQIAGAEDEPPPYEEPQIPGQEHLSFE
jgi:hypothetical protein